MKRFLISLIFILSLVNKANAEVTATDLMGLGMPALLADKVASIGTGSASLDNNTSLKARNAADSADISLLKADATDDTVLNADTGDIIKFQIGGTTELELYDDELLYTGTAVTIGGNGSLKLKADNDTQRVVTYDASSDTDLTLTFGDGGTTALQALSILGSTANGDDDATICLGGGGGCTRTQGSFVKSYGNEVASVGGNLELSTGDNASDTVDFFQGATNIASVGGTGMVFNQSGDTISIQESVAGDKCMGTVTANGTTAVTVSTTCASTGARILIARSSAPSGTAICWQTNIVNGVSFDLDCSGAETGTFDWFILKESA